MATLHRRRFLSHSALAGGALVGGALAAWPSWAADEVIDSTEWIDEPTDTAIKKGLEYLAGRQQADGSFPGSGYSRNLAVCALTGMAFMAAGSTPMRGPYGLNTRRCVDYVMDHATDNGLFLHEGSSSHGPMYEHGFATLFLAEAYGMTMRRDIREKLAKAVRLIVETQNDEGGWRYQPSKSEADISVTICQMMALRAAKNAGLYVPNETRDRCIDYVKKSQNADGGFMYMVHGGASAFPRSAAGVVALYSAGYSESGARKRAGLPDEARPGGRSRFGRRPLFLRPLLRRAGHVARRRRLVEEVVSRHPRGADGCRLEAPPAGRRLVGGRHGLRGVRHRHGLHHPADAEQLPADLSALTAALPAITELVVVLVLEEASRRRTTAVRDGSEGLSSKKD